MPLFYQVATLHLCPPGSVYQISQKGINTQAVLRKITIAADACFVLFRWENLFLQVPSNCEYTWIFLHNRLAMINRTVSWRHRFSTNDHRSSASERVGTSTVCSTLSRCTAESVFERSSQYVVVSTRLLRNHKQVYSSSCIAYDALKYLIPVRKCAFAKNAALHLTTYFPYKHYLHFSSCTKLSRFYCAIVLLDPNYNRKRVHWFLSFWVENNAFAISSITVNINLEGWSR